MLSLNVRTVHPCMKTIMHHTGYKILVLSGYPNKPPLLCCLLSAAARSALRYVLKEIATVGTETMCNLQCC